MRRPSSDKPPPSMTPRRIASAVRFVPAGYVRSKLTCASSFRSASDYAVVEAENGAKAALGHFVDNALVLGDWTRIRSPGHAATRLSARARSSFAIGRYSVTLVPSPGLVSIVR